MSNEMIRYLFSWSPTFVFLFAVLGGFIIGLIRGFRKSTIFLIHSAGAFLICLILYFSFVNSAKLDSNMLNFVNFILSRFNQGSLQEMLNVSQECQSITEILVEFIPKQMNFGDGFLLIVSENGAYLKTIVDLAYHVIIALLMLFLYSFILFVLYFIYLFFYSERKYKKKRNKQYLNAEIEKEYKKRRLLGGVIGLVQSTVVSVVFLAFSASLLFIAGGGIGDKNYDDYSEIVIEENNLFNDPNVNTYFEFYKCFKSYGNEGIYKLLNLVKNKDDVPFYLFAVDIVFQGGLKDDSLGIDENIYFRRELGEYTNFATDTFDLLLKYGGSDIANFINGKDTENKDLFGLVYKIMLREEFQNDFNLLIDNFNDNTYFINFGLSFINSFARNINQEITFLDGLPPTVKEILEILFVGENKIKASDLLSKDDIKALTGLIFKSLSYNQENPSVDGDTVSMLVNYGTIILPELSKLSILNSNDKTDTLNNTIKELYTYFINKINPGSQVLTASDVVSRASLNNSISDVNWIEELKAILAAGADIIVIYSAIADTNSDMLTAAFNLFDSNNPNSSRNEEAFDNVTDMISDSKLLGVVLSSFLNDSISSIASSMSPDIKMPTSYSYSNEYDQNGQIIKYGELYNVLKLIKSIAKNEQAKEIFTAESDDTNQMMKYIDIFNIETSPGKKILDDALESEIFEYLISGILFNVTIGEANLYIPNDLIIDGRDDISLIKKEELSNVLSSVPDIINLLGSGDINIDTIINSDEIRDAIINSRIIEGTMANLIISLFSNNESIVIPNRLHTVENWFAVEGDGEIIKLFDAIKAMNIIFENFNINELVITNEKVIEMLKSDILYYTLSKNIENSLVSIVDIPDEVYVTIDAELVITKEEISSLVNGVIVLNETPEGILISNLNMTEFSITNEKVNALLNSRIAHRLLTVKIEEALNNDIPMTTYDSTGLYILSAEINNLISSVSDSTGALKIGGTDQSDMSFNSIKEEKFEYMSNSIIVRYKVTSILKSQGQVVLPNYVGFMESDANSKEYICTSEFKSFLDAFYAGYGADGVINTNNISVELPSEDKFDLVLSSTIIRATITSKLKININGESNDVLIEISDLDVNSTDIVIISKSELLNALNAITVITSGNSFEIELSLSQIAALNKESIYKITKSNMIRLILNNIIRDTPSLTYSEIFRTTSPTLTIYDGSSEVVVDNSVYLVEESGLYKLNTSYATLSDSIAVFNINTKLQQNENIYCDLINNTTTSQYMLQVYLAMYSI